MSRKLNLSDETLDRIERLITETLDEKFAGEDIRFGPIFMERRSDFIYGDEFLRIFIITEGDRSLLKPRWRLDFRAMIEEAMFPEVDAFAWVRNSFTDKSEWDEFQKKKERKPWIHLA